MTNLFQTLEGTAARGAEGLTPEARESIAAALQARQAPDGGFAGLDGKSDPYYSLFAWLGLRALGAAYVHNRLCAYMAAHRRDANTVDAQCASFVRACEGHPPHVPWLTRAEPATRNSHHEGTKKRRVINKLRALRAFVVQQLVFYHSRRFIRHLTIGGSLLRGDTLGVYTTFMLALAVGNMPRWLARLLWWRQRRLFAAGSVEHAPTPHLAAGLILASLAGECASDILSVLASRHCANGGFTAAPKALPDLLATAVARFSIGNQQSSIGEEIKADLAFVEACWLEDGLFGASPNVERGDAEHTFYGLLALGTCR